MDAATKQVVVIAGPSGSGKNSVIDALIAKYPNCTRLVTATTRAPRPGEQNAIDYYFLSEEQFMQELGVGNILEHRDIKSLNTHYGVYKPDLQARFARGEIIVAQLDIIGVRFMKEHYNATTFFIMPQSLDELRQRILKGSRNLSEAEISARMEIAQKEIEEDAPQCDYRIVNENGKLSEAIDNIVAILKKEGYTLE